MLERIGTTTTVCGGLDRGRGGTWPLRFQQEVGGYGPLAHCHARRSRWAVLRSGSIRNSRANGMSFGWAVNTLWRTPLLLSVARQTACVNRANFD